MPNAIDCRRFSFDPKVRAQMRQELGVEDSFVVGHVGRFNLQKNHTFLLRLFQALLTEIPTAKLLLLGEGELWDSVQQQARQLEIADHVIFAGVHKDCERYYQAMDAFVLPSLFEGLPVTGIEAQYAGLPCFFADTISRETAITASAKFLGIQEADIPVWCRELNAAANAERKAVTDLTTDAFHSDTAARNMAQLYQKMWEKESC